MGINTRHFLQPSFSSCPLPKKDMKPFVVAALFCAVAHLAQGGVSGEADIHNGGASWGSGNIYGGFGVGDGLHTGIYGGAGAWGHNNGIGSYGYGGNNYGHGATSYSSGISRSSDGSWGNQYGNKGYNGNDGGYASGHSQPWHNTYGGSGISHTERHDGHGSGYSATSLKLENGATSYSKVSYGGSKHY